MYLASHKEGSTHEKIIFGRDFSHSHCVSLNSTVTTAHHEGVSNQTSTKKKSKPPCSATLADCPDEGCGGQIDSNLNKLKNIHSDDGSAATLRSLAWMKKLDDPIISHKGKTAKN